MSAVRGASSRCGTGAMDVVPASPEARTSPATSRAPATLKWSMSWKDSGPARRMAGRRSRYGMPCALQKAVIVSCA